MPAELINVLLQLGVAGVFIWFLYNQLDRREKRLTEYEKEVCRLRDEYDELLMARIHDKERQETILWQIGRALQQLAESERRRNGKKAGGSTDSPRERL